MQIQRAKVPEATVMFWLAKAVTTALGEATSDFLVRAINPVLAVGIGFAAFVIAMAVQFARPAYTPWAYWLAVAMVGVFGTMAADVLHVAIGVPYIVSTVVFGAALLAIFVSWWRIERTVSIHSITTTRREVFYWLAVVATFALGTAAGDLTAVTLRLGYFEAGGLFAVLIATVFVSYRAGLLNAVAGFWTAYVFTRPFGASYADWLGVSHARGGLGVGSGIVSLGLAVVLIALVAYLQVAGRAAPARRSPSPRRAQVYGSSGDI